MKPLQPSFNPSDYSERADGIFGYFDGPDYAILPIVGPFSYFYNLRSIAKIRQAHDLGEAKVRSNILIWGKGEPLLSFQTKFGGSPFRPADLPWPRGERGQFLPFIAQLNFSSVKEHNYEKELLLIFGEIIEDELVEFHAEWYSPLNGDILSLVPPPKGVIWPASNFYAEMAQIEFFPALCNSSTLLDEIRKSTGLGNINYALMPTASALLGWDGNPTPKDEDPKWIAVIGTFNPYFATELAWLNADEAPEDVKERSTKYFSEGFGPGGYPDRWFGVGDMGRLVIGINDAGEVEGWIESH